MDPGTIPQKLVLGKKNPNADILIINDILEYLEMYPFRNKSENVCP